MMRFALLTACLTLSFTMAGCKSAQSTKPASADIPAPAASAQAVQPLNVGDAAAGDTVQTPTGEAFALTDAYANGPTMLVFYRGGWCPYCNTHLGEISTIEGDLTDMGFQVLAVSPDRPEALQNAVKEQGFSYQLLSDSAMELTRRFGLAFRVDEPTYTQLLSYDINLEAASGQTHHLLPVPAVYLIDRDGVIRFAHWDADYKQRLSTEDMLAAARAMR